MRYKNILLLATAGLVLGLPPCAPAQVKIGANPTQIVSGAALQVDGDASTSTPASLIVNSAKNLGVGTATPQNRVEITSAAAGNSGLRLTNLPGASALATNASGDVISTTVTAACTCGDIKQGLQTADHGNWYKMDGRSSVPANSCGIASLPNATGAVLVQESGTLGGAVAADAIPRSALPNTSLTGTTAADGIHSHGNNSSNSNGGYGLVNVSGGGNNTTDGGLDHTPGEPNLVARPSALTIYNSSSHTHAFTTGSLNGNVTQTSLTTSNLPRIRVNTFLCLR